jgi:hypothetical protein
MTADEIKLAVVRAQEKWRPPSELLRSTPRSVSLTWLGIVLSCLAVLLLGGGAFLGPWLFVQAGRDQALLERMAVEGAVTGGTVRSIGLAHGEDNHRKITFRYEVNGKSYDTSTTVGSNAAKGLQEAGGVQVRYLATDPSRSWIVGHEPQRTPVWVSPLAGLGMMVGPALIFFQLKRQRSLLTEGRPAVGVTTRIGWAGGYHDGEGKYRARYQFRAQDGQTYKGSFRGSKRGCGAVGDSITVLYDADNPKRSTRYPMQFVRIAEW